MPFISSSIPLTGLQDRRRKLTEEDKAEIIRLYESGLGSLRSLGERFCVSKSTILYIVNPERREKVRQRTKEHWRDYRPTKEEWAETMREHRRYKQGLYLAGELTTKGD